MIFAINEANIYKLLRCFVFHFADDPWSVNISQCLFGNQITDWHLAHDAHT